MKQYLRDLWLYLRGFRWLWSDRIHYRPGWTPLKFLLPYCTTYLLSTLLGLGIRPFSGWLYIRSTERVSYQGVVYFDPEPGLLNRDRWRNSLAIRAVRILDRLLGTGHCAQSATAPLLWGSRSVW